MTNSIKLSSEKVAVADFALLFFGDAGVATLHDVDRFGDGPRIREGRLLRQDDLSRLGGILQQAGSRPSLILPERVLGAGPGFLTWYKPAHKAPMRFLVGGKLFESEVIWPSLIFHARGGKLFAVAYVSEARPDADTPVFAPPLMNFYDSTAMCRGSASYPANHDPATVPEWEFAVFGTHFTHINNSVKLRGREQSTESHLAFWRHPARARYPLKAKHLVDLCWAPTCGEWLAEISGESDSEHGDEF